MSQGGARPGAGTYQGTVKVWSRALNKPKRIPSLLSEKKPQSCARKGGPAGRVPGALPTRAGAAEPLLFRVGYPQGQRPRPPARLAFLARSRPVSWWLRFPRARAPGGPGGVPAARGGAWAWPAQRACAGRMRSLVAPQAGREGDHGGHVLRRGGEGALPSRDGGWGGGRRGEEGDARGQGGPATAGTKEVRCWARRRRRGPGGRRSRGGAQAAGCGGSRRVRPRQLRVGLRRALAFFKGLL